MEQPDYFEVRRNGKVIFHCGNHKECIPDRDTQNALREAGYSIWVDGKEKK